MRYFLYAFLLGVYLLFVYGYIRKKVSEKSVEMYCVKGGFTI